MDASGEGIGVLLAQREDDDPTEHTVAYASPTLTKSERNFSTFLAIVCAVRKLRRYFYGLPFGTIRNTRKNTCSTNFFLLSDPSGT